MLYNAFIAGFLIGLGCLISNLISQPIINYCCFATGLMYVRAAKLPLTTGLTQHLGETINFKTWSKVLICNMLGAFAASFFSMLFLAAAHNYELMDKLAILSRTKFMDSNFLQLLLSGAFCGALMTIATYKKTPLYISVLCVMAFLMAGFNHCVADSFYLFMQLGNWYAWLMFVAIVLGNLIGGYVIKKEGT